MTNETPPPPASPPKTGGILSQPLMWLVLGIPAATVVAGFITLWIAADGADRPVPSYFTKQGLSVAPDTTREDRARALGFSGEISTQVDQGQLQIRLKLKPSEEAETAEGTASITPQRLRLLHPSNPENDITLHLRAEGDEWLASQPLTWTPDTRWNVVIEGLYWRLPLPGLLTVDNLRQHPIDVARSPASRPAPSASPAGTAKP
ncbi:MAG: FixH family protein [Lautropia sp.]|nr:FixH family protein [Lautropia sp.]